MPTPNLSQASGSDINELIDSLEKQRKELNWILQHLDNTNVVELNADVINAGTINGKHIFIDDTVTFAGGYDPIALQTTVNTQFSVQLGLIESKASSTVVTELGNVVHTVQQSVDGLTGQIYQKVSYSDYTGFKIASLIVQDAFSINLIGENINLTGYVTINSLGSPGAVIIHEGNIVSESLTVGRGSGNPQLSIYSAAGSHRIHSFDAAGFRIQSQSHLSLQAGGSAGTVYSNSKFWATAGFQVTGTSQLQMVEASNVYATTNMYIYSNGTPWPVATQKWVTDVMPNTTNFAQWSDTYSIARGGASLKFLYGSATIQARNYWDSAFGTFEGLAYSNVSRRELKKDIEHYEKDALTELMGTQVYSYRYNSDLLTEPKRVGLIFDEAPLDVMNFNGGVDVYALASMLVKAVQQLNQKVEQLQVA